MENTEQFLDSSPLFKSVIQVQCAGLDSGPLFPYIEMYTSVFQKLIRDYSLFKTEM